MLGKETIRELDRQTTKLSYDIYQLTGLTTLHTHTHTHTHTYTCTHTQTHTPPQYFLSEDRGSLRGPNVSVSEIRGQASITLL